MSTIDIIFDGPPSHESGRFVEVERDGKSINYGEWEELDNGLWALRIFDPAEHEATIKEQAEEITRVLERNAFISRERDAYADENYKNRQEMSDVCETSLAQKVDAIKLREEIEQLKAKNKTLHETNTVLANRFPSDNPWISVDDRLPEETGSYFIMPFDKDTAPSAMWFDGDGWDCYEDELPEFWMSIPTTIHDKGKT